jgi:uncharacterized membrane protein
MTASTATLSPGLRAVILTTQHGILHIARHWLAITNTLSAILAGLPLLAAWLLAAGRADLANPIFVAYALVCEQNPDHTFFPWGQPMAYCQRDTAIYTTYLLAGLAFIPLRRRLRPLSWWAFLLLSAPLAIDGFTQFFGWRESTPLLRLLTGTLFGVAVVWLIYPRLERGMAEIVATLEARFRRRALRAGS